MNNRVFWVFGFLGLVLVALFARCQSEEAKTSMTDAPPALEQLLSAADTLSAEVLAAEARKLPGTWVDSFFDARCTALALRQDGRMLSRELAIYEKIRPGNEAVGAFVQLRRGIVHQFATRFDSAEIYYKLAQGWYEKSGDKLKLRDALDCRSSVCRLQGRFDEAVAIQYQALELAEKEIDKMYMKVKIAQTLVVKEDTTKALELLQEPIRFYEQIRDTHMYAFALAVEGNAFALKKDFAKCIELHQKSLSLRLQSGKHNFATENLHAIATMHNKLGNWQAALDTIKTAERILTQLGNKQGLAFFQFATGEALFHLGRLPEAEVLLLQNLEKSRARKQYKVAWSAADLLSKSKKKQGKLSEALDFREQSTALKDSLFNKEKERIVQDATFKYETREKEAQIAALKMEKRFANQRSLLIGAFLLSLAGAGAGFLRYRHRREKALLEKDIETKRLENEVLLANENLNRQAMENAAHELQLHKAQLEEFTVLMLEKNTKIESLQSEIEQISLPGESKPARQADPDSDDVDALFQASLITETDWQRFQRHFDKVFPGTSSRLKFQHPELTTAEHQLVLLTKMGLKAKDIAGFFGITPESVRKLKYRFKKKTGLSEEELIEKLGLPVG